VVVLTRGVALPDGTKVGIREVWVKTFHQVIPLVSLSLMWLSLTLELLVSEFLDLVGLHESVFADLDRRTVLVRVMLLCFALSLAKFPAVVATQRRIVPRENVLPR